MVRSDQVAVIMVLGDRRRYRLPELSLLIRLGCVTGVILLEVVEAFLSKGLLRVVVKCVTVFGFGATHLYSGSKDDLGPPDGATFNAHCGSCQHVAV